MKIIRLVIGIFSCILFAVITLQSCAIGALNALSETQDLGGAAGIWLAIFMLAAGIVAIATKDSYGGGIAAGVLYAFGAVFGLFYNGIFRDLVFWATVSIVFSLVCLVGTIIADNRKKIDTQYKEWESKQDNVKKDN